MRNLEILADDYVELQYFLYQESIEEINWEFALAFDAN